MDQSILKSRDELREKFDAARVGIDREVVDRVMRGLPIEGGHAEPYPTLLRAWAAYHAAMK